MKAENTAAELSVETLRLYERIRLLSEIEPLMTAAAEDLDAIGRDAALGQAYVVRMIDWAKKRTVAAAERVAEIKGAMVGTTIGSA